MIRVLLILAALLAASSAGAQEELRGGFGSAEDEDYSDNTYGWELDYAHGFSEHSYLTLGWINEGHQLNDHRDGFNTQFWGHADLFDHRLAFAVGAGPYFYFDTERDEAHPSYASYGDDHGLKLIWSAELTWYVSRNWLTYLRSTRVGADSQLTILGLGYRFDGPFAPESTPDSTAAPLESLGNEFGLYIGQTALNSFVSERSTAYALDYRYRLSNHVDWSIGWLNEGGNDIIRRNGVISEGWLFQPLLEGRLELGAGAGIYLVVNQQDQTFVVQNGHVVGVGSDDDRLSGIVSLTADYRFDSHWSLRASFNRLVTRYDRDADVILIGAGYRF